MNTVIQTYSGSGLDILNPLPRDFRILDIAESLGKVARFTGHTQHHYSVAQHSVLVSILLDGTGLEMEGLMHDAAESITGDVSSPRKVARVEMCYRLTGESGVDPIKDITRKIDTAIAKQFGLLYPRPAAVKAADLEAMTLERRQLMLPASGVAWSTDVKTRDYGLAWMNPDDASAAFLNRYNQILWRPKTQAPS